MIAFLDAGQLSPLTVILGILDPLHKSLAPMVEMWESSCLLLSLFLFTRPQGISRGSKPGDKSVHISEALSSPHLRGFRAQSIMHTQFQLESFAVQSINRYLVLHCPLKVFIYGYSQMLVHFLSSMIFIAVQVLRSQLSSSFHLTIHHIAPIISYDLTVTSSNDTASDCTRRKYKSPQERLTLAVPHSTFLPP